MHSVDVPFQIQKDRIIFRSEKIGMSGISAAVNSPGCFTGPFPICITWIDARQSSFDSPVFGGEWHCQTTKDSLRTETWLLSAESDGERSPTFMKLLPSPLRWLQLVCCQYALTMIVAGHDLGNPNETHPRYDFSVKPPTVLQPPVWFVARVDPKPSKDLLPGRSQNVLANQPSQAEIFLAFKPKVSVRWDRDFLYIESDGLPAHNLMVGITSWQQQVPLPQSYTGLNAWRFPLHPTIASQPLSIRGRFLRGAIAIAANGIPIFNPQNNRGEISAEIGELDAWGGHCGRSDDYHYHAAPLHLQEVLGNGRPIAYALDGYPIYGLTEPDGGMPTKLDAFHGHETDGMGYHYHGSTRYPFVNGGFHGVVDERDGQVDPQPRAESPRPAMPPLRGAQITGFRSKADKIFSLEYKVGGETRFVNYAVETDGSVKFEYLDGQGNGRTEKYPGGPPPSRRTGLGPAPPRDPDGGDANEINRQRSDGNRDGRSFERPRGAKPASSAVEEYIPKRSGHLILGSPAFSNGGSLPVEFTGDGSGVSPPLEWNGGPPETRSYALTMHHIDREGVVKWYWIVYNISADVRSIIRDARGVGIFGNNSVNRVLGYAPPHSKGPGAKVYTITLYALSRPLKFSIPPEAVDRAALLTAMKDVLLDSAELQVVYDRSGRIVP
jgi:phosphatidylethanolamine-binding protein (PEBP) family uncharacterized protein